MQLPHLFSSRPIRGLSRLLLAVACLLYMPLLHAQDLASIVRLQKADSALIAYDYPTAQRLYEGLTQSAVLPAVELQRRIALARDAQRLSARIATPICLAKRTIHKEELHRLLDTVTPPLRPLATTGRLGLDSLAPAEATRYATLHAQYQGAPNDIYLLHGPDSTTLPATINTAHNEAQPLYDPSNNTLYFSSEGRGGFGAHDIYYARYDSLTGAWGEAQNLGFGFNSSSDDYLLTLPHASIFLIASRRNASPDSLTILWLAPPRNAASAQRLVPETMARLARFDKPKGWRGPAPSNKRNRSARVAYASVEADPEYKRALEAGNRAQASADSARKKLAPLREKLWDAESLEERQRIEDAIKPIEAKMLSAQRTADLHYEEASRIEREYVTGTRSNLGGKAPKGGFSSDNPSYLHLAQAAPIVMQRDERDSLIRELELRNAASKLFDSIQKQLHKLRKLETNATASTVQIAQAEANLWAMAQRYIDSQEGMTEERLRILRSCLPVALVKGHRTSAPQVQAAETQAFDRLRIASGWQRGGPSDSLPETLFRVHILQRIACEYLELGFCYTWGMEGYRARVVKRLERLESLHALLGATPDDPAPATPPTPAGIPKPLVAGLQRVDNPPYHDSLAIPVGLPRRAGVVYRLQLGAFSKPLNPSIFNGLTPIVAEAMQGGTVIKYYAGEFATQAEAAKGKALCVEAGFPDAFLLAWYNGRPVATPRAKALEGEEPQKELPAAGNFRVALGSFCGSLPNSLSITVQHLFPKAKLVRMPDGSKSLYLIAGFRTYPEALRACYNLRASVCPNASVVSE